MSELYAVNNLKLIMSYVLVRNKTESRISTIGQKTFLIQKRSLFMIGPF